MSLKDSEAFVTADVETSQKAVCGCGRRHECQGVCAHLRGHQDAFPDDLLGSGPDGIPHRLHTPILPLPLRTIKHFDGAQEDDSAWWIHVLCSAFPSGTLLIPAR